MIRALFLALGQVLDPPSRGVVWRGVAGALAALAALWTGVGYALSHLALTGVPWLDGAVDVLGGLAVFVVSWMLFPAAVVAVSGFFIDEVVDRVEARHYPGLTPPRPVLWTEELAAALRLFALAGLVNLAALPIYLMTPVLNLPIYLAVNGWLASREYFDLVARRRMSGPEAVRLRASRPAGVFLAGVVVVGLSTIPLVNLLVPVIAGALFVHLFHRSAALGAMEGLRAPGRP